MDISYTETQCNNIEVQYGPETMKDWTNRLKTTLKNNFDKANSTGKQSTLFADHVQQDRVIVDTSYCWDCSKTIANNHHVQDNVLLSIAPQMEVF